MGKVTFSLVPFNQLGTLLFVEHETQTMSGIDLKAKSLNNSVSRNCVGVCVVYVCSSSRARVSSKSPL